MDKNSADLRVIKTRQNIKNAVLELMSEKTISSITITDVSKKAMINRKTFYRHYNSVDEVIMEIEEDILSTLYSLLNKNNTSCLEIGIVLEYIGKTIQMYKDTLYKTLKLSPEYIYSGRLKELLRKTTEVSIKKVVGITNDSTLRVMSQFLVSGVLSVYAEWLENDCKESLEFIVKTTRKISHACLSNLLAEEDIKNIDLR